MEIITHKNIDPDLCGNPVLLEKGKSVVELITAKAMTADHTGLVHGGFIFGLADYAAMIAVNHPNVVLGAADVKFLKPVKCGEKVIARAVVEEIQGKKQQVSVSVEKDDTTVFTGIFTCFVLAHHVLES